MRQSWILFGLFSTMTMLGSAGCSQAPDDGSDGPGEEAEGALGGASTVRLQDYSIASGLIAAGPDAVAIREAIESTGKGIAADRDTMLAGIEEDGDDEGFGVVCGLDGASRTPVCSLNAVVENTDVTKKKLHGVYVTTKVTVRAKLAQAIYDALPVVEPQRVGASVHGAGAIACTRPVVRQAETTCVIPSAGVVATLQSAIDMTRASDGQAAADEAKAEAIALVKRFGL
jgi:hypothetical protein